MADPQIELFHSRYRRGPGCWEWTRSTRGVGYGKMQFQGRRIGAHRIAYMLANGPIPEGMMVCHKCDNRACVRPDHLFVGTAHDNVTDMIRKGRGNWKGPKGERAPAAKLTAEQVIEIRRRYAAGGETYVNLGREFGVTNHAIFRVVKRLNWAHLDDMGDRISGADRQFIPVCGS